MGFFDKIKQSLTKTTQQFVERFEEVGQARRRAGSGAAAPIDLETIEALEEALISADVGVAATERIVEPRCANRRSRDASLRDLVKAEILSILRGAGRAGIERAPARTS